MIIIMNGQARAKDVARVLKEIKNLQCKPHISKGKERTIIGVVGDVHSISLDRFSALLNVEQVLRVSKPFKLASREFHPDPTAIEIRGITIGGGNFTVMAGPCAIESKKVALRTGHLVAKAGAVVFRGGAYKPRTSPYSFQGLGLDGLKILNEVRRETGLLIITEVLGVSEVSAVSKCADILQIGARNMQNFRLLEAVGKVRMPVLLKRGMMSTIEEWLLAAEYILKCGNPYVMLCERGIRTFEKYTRNTLDISAVPVVKRLSHLPVIIDPSHAAGHREYVEQLSYAAMAAGADGVIIEVHPEPDKALSDGEQSITPDQFGAICKKFKKIAPVFGFKLNMIR